MALMAVFVLWFHFLAAILDAVWLTSEKKGLKEGIIFIVE